MNGAGSKKLGNFKTESDDEWLDRQMRDIYVALKAKNGAGGYASRNIANAAHGLTAPHRSLAKRIREARRAKASAEFARQLGEVLVEYADRIYGRSKEFHPAA